MEEALASLSAQEMGDELEVIVQDGTTEYTEHTESNESLEPGVQSLGLEGLRYFREEDQGQSDALNRGFAKAKGEWLFWLNADDVLLPGVLRSLEFKVQSLQFKDAEWIVGDTVYIDEWGIVQEVRRDARWRCWFAEKMSVWTGGPSAFFRRGVWERIGGLDTNLKYVMDIDLWTRWARAGIRFESLKGYVWGFRMHGGSKTMGGQNLIEHREERDRVSIKHGISHERFWRNMTRLSSILDGTWISRRVDSKALRGRRWEDIT